MRNRRRKEVEMKKKRERVVLLTLGILIFIYLTLTLILGNNGFLRYVQLVSIRTGIQTEIKGIKRQNEEMKKQIDMLKKDPNIIEELARKQGLTREDEIIFKFKDKEEKEQ